jgi:hypothetical protein
MKMQQENSPHKSLIELFQLLKDRFCKEDYIVLKKFAISFLWKFHLSEYHKEEISDAFIRELSCSKKTEYIESIKGMFSNFSKKSDNSKYRIAFFKSEAHLIAFAQNLHSTADICAHLITFCVPNLKELYLEKQSRINLHFVKDQLTDPETQDIKQTIMTFLDSKEFQYLNAFVNTIKHKEIISTNDFVSFETQPNPNRNLKIESFKYKKKQYESILSSELSEKYFTLLQELYCAIFNELKKYVGGLKPAPNSGS